MQNNQAGTQISDKKEYDQMSFWEHLDEFLARMRIVFITVIVSGLFIGFFPANPKGLLDPSGIYEPIIAVIMHRIKYDILPSEATLIAGGLMDTAYVYVAMAFLIGIAVSSPLIGYQIFAFITPALYPSEKQHTSKFLAAFLVLFVFGIIIAYLAILPLTMRIILWFIKSGGAEPLINIKDFYTMVITLMIGSGLLYTVPALLVLLVQVGILPANFIEGKRKIVYVAILVVTAVITPDPTIVTDIIILVPFLILFESAVLIAKRVERNKPSENSV
ncbi:twin-arginine translocase subunit TatC [[Eubacterium] cellulosolvens]